MIWLYSPTARNIKINKVNKAMSGGSIIVIAFLAFVAITIFKGVRIVPQGYKWIVQRLGKYHTTLNPGLNFVIPYVDEVAYKVTTKDIVLDIPSQEVITRDNAGSADECGGLYQPDNTRKSGVRD